MKSAIVRLIDRVIFIVNRSDFEYAELQAAVIAILSAICFMVPGQFLRVSPDLRAAAAVTFLLVGVVQFCGLVSRIHALRRGAAFCGAVAWFSLVSMFGSDELLLAVWSFAFGMASSWGYVRLGKHPLPVVELRKV